MKVRINGEDLDFSSLVSIAEFIIQRKIRPETVVVEHNGVILDRDKWESTMLKENDALEVLSFFGGG
ncbi:MAG: sulfur carrier protein ThiS [Candidatus Omnitrophota bacterium]|nr:sulfur carrier protein ThiS [Candidatus Omnitrophota bacterium]